MAKVLLARIDRIGDLVLSLPVHHAWKSANPEDRLVWLVSEDLRFVMQNWESLVPCIFVSSPKSFINRVKNCIKLAGILKAEKFDVVVALHVPWWAAWAFLFSGISERVGAASQWFSWFCFNKTLRQRRSISIKHESDYNSDLIEFALHRTGLKFSPVQLAPRPGRVSSWKIFFKEKGIGHRGFVVIHPGMGGSARNWSPPFYREAAERFLAADISVVLTGGDQDASFVTRTGIKSLVGVIDLVGKTDGEDLLAILSLSKTVVAPSTGVAHLAAALGVPVAAIYSPVRVQAPRRWAPRGNRVQVFVPQVDCPGRFSCLGPKCPLYDCMTQIAVDSVVSYGMNNLHDTQ